jgi:steroid delta-isomerase-like uncharacterized protein
MTTQEAENTELMRRLQEEVFAAGNVDAIDEFLAEDFVQHYPKGRVLNGLTEFREEVGSELAAFPDLSPTIEEIVAEDDLVVVRLVVRGTHEGEFMGHAATGNEFEIDEMHMARIEDGKLVEQWSQADLVGMLEQIGVA